MRREASTIVALVGAVPAGLPAALSRSPNVTVASVPSDQAALPGWAAGAAAMRAAARFRSTYVVVPADPLAAVAAAWQQMWDVSDDPAAAAAFEREATEAVAAWQDKGFELPDYYLVIGSDQGGDARPDLYLGPLRAVRPRRVVIGGTAGGAEQTATVRDALRSLEHGPWWPPLDEIIGAARTFYAGRLAPG
jgi:hypothetical protein